MHRPSSCILAGYSREEAARRPFPILLLNDGQNVFEDALSFSGCSWRAGEAAAALITSGQLPPFLIAGIDHAGPDRSQELLPYKPGTGPGAFLWTVMPCGGDAGKVCASLCGLVGVSLDGCGVVCVCA